MAYFDRVIRDGRGNVMTNHTGENHSVQIKQHGGSRTYTLSEKTNTAGLWYVDGVIDDYYDLYLDGTYDEDQSGPNGIPIGNPAGAGGAHDHTSWAESVPTWGTPNDKTTYWETEFTLPVALSGDYIEVYLNGIFLPKEGAVGGFWNGDRFQFVNTTTVKLKTTFEPSSTQDVVYVRGIKA